MTAKFDAFKAALERLCIEHEVTLTTSGYDMISVRDYEPVDGPIWQDCIEDRTEAPAQERAKGAVGVKP